MKTILSNTATIKRIFFFGTLILAGLWVLNSCRKDSNEFCTYGFKKATVAYTGAPEVDGCGWLVIVDSVAFHPVNLPEDFHKADLPVLIKYNADPQEFRCGRGGVIYPSIRISEIKWNAPEVGILNNGEWDKYYMDPFRMDSAFVEGDFLLMRVSYSGGCVEHELKLWKLPPNALTTPPVELALSHNSKGDMCDAYFTRWLSFSLIPLREAGKHELTFLLRGSPEMSAYFGSYQYKY